MSREAELLARVVAADVVLREATGEKPAAVTRIAGALLAKGGALSGLGRHAEALECFQDLISRLTATGATVHDQDLLAAMMWAGDELLALGRGHQAQEAAEAALERAAALDPQERARVESHALLQQAAAIGQQGKARRALTLLGDLIMRFGAAPDVSVRRHVVEAMRRRAELLHDAGRADEAIEMYEGIARLAVGARDAALRHEAFFALAQKALLMRQTGRNSEALVAVDLLLATPTDFDAFEEGERSGVRGAIARALMMRAELLAGDGRWAEAIVIWHDVVERFADEPPAGEPYLLFDALAQEADALAVSGDMDASIERFGALLSRYGGDRREYVVEKTLGELGRVGLLLIRCDRGDDAIRLCDETLERFGGVQSHSSDAAILVAILRARFLLRIGRDREALDAALGIADVIAGSRERVLTVDLADHLVRLGGDLCGSHPAEALAISREVRTQLEDAYDRKLREMAVHALHNESVALAQLGRQLESAAAYEALASFGEVAVQAFDATIARTQDRTDTDHRSELAAAFLAKVSVLRLLNREREALATLDSLLPRFESDGEPMARAVVDFAHRTRDEILGGISGE